VLRKQAVLDGLGRGDREWDRSFVAQTGSARKMVGASMVARVWLVVKRMGTDETETRREALRNKLCR